MYIKLPQPVFTGSVFEREKLGMLRLFNIITVIIVLVISGILLIKRNTATFGHCNNV